jgi:hypothetical protein
VSQGGDSQSTTYALIPTNPTKCLKDRRGNPDAKPSFIESYGGLRIGRAHPGTSPGCSFDPFDGSTLLDAQREHY